ncbi:matrixin family metalloprotease [Aquimarina litoralis]|uniref:matrixin family metalloprotease n=1 Tax=Aquimarina litoralis TaxID=584605 RepID=UPI001C5857EB|nr:matrixin family metalloprotease [Aquimarina litoralis]MBW1296497.1 matrixin family metalloprotease [Aquimarina litoralis]
MRFLRILVVLSIFASCTTEDDYVPYQVEQVFSDNLEKTIKVDIIYVQPSNKASKVSYGLNETHFIDNLNGSFFHRYGIGLEMGDIKTLNNDELYDLKDNRGQEASVFLQQTQDSYREDRISVYVMKRSNTIAIAGIGKDKRALITDEFLYTSTAPHEIGHALGLHHYHEEGNIMSQIRPYLRKDFTDEQIAVLKETLEKIEN